MEPKRDDGGQAFPMIDVAIDGQALGSAGMSLRDWFAGQALVGILTHDAGINSYNLAMDCYMIADAMLKARAE